MWIPRLFLPLSLLWLNNILDKFLFFSMFVNTEISRLRLHRLDISGNRISGVPCDIRRMDTLQEIVMDNNPLVFPPASVSSNTMAFDWTPIFSLCRLSTVTEEWCYTISFVILLVPVSDDCYQNNLKSKRKLPIIGTPVICPEKNCALEP